MLCKTQLDLKLFSLQFKTRSLENTTTNNYFRKIVLHKLKTILWMLYKPRIVRNYYSAKFVLLISGPTKVVSITNPPKTMLNWSFFLCFSHIYVVLLWQICYYLVNCDALMHSSYNDTFTAREKGEKHRNRFQCHKYHAYHTWKECIIFKGCSDKTWSKELIVV